MPSPLVLVPAYALLVAAGATLGLVGGFYHLLTLGVAGVRLPLALPVIAAALAVLALGGARGCRSRAGAVVPTAAWLTVTLLLADPRPEGDVVVTGSAVSLGYLLTCTVVAGVAVAVGWRGRVDIVE